MKVDKVLNNNTVICLDDYGKEIILMGRGLAFGKKPGADVDPQKAEKRFALDDDELTKRFVELIKNIPMKHIFLSEQIINYANIALDTTLSDAIYITLSDHIASVIERYKKKIIVPNLLLYEIKQFYQREFEIGLAAIDMIKKATGLNLSHDEAGYIAMHIVNAEIGSGANVYEMTELTQKIYTMIIGQLDFEVDKNSIHFYRFITHLKFFAKRILIGTQYGDDLTSLLDSLKLQYPKSYEIAKNVCEYVEKENNFHSDKNEILYLTVHIAKLMESVEEQEI